ncbi:MAG: hypothetical protein ABF334_08855 [Akkermansiaceae bacterium]
MREWDLDDKIEFVKSFPEVDRLEKWQMGMKALQFHFSKNHSEEWFDNPYGLTDLRKKMEQLRPLLMELGYSDIEPHRFYAAELSKYLIIDDEVKNMVYNVLEKSFSEYGQSKNSSLETIFGYGLETDELKGELLNGLSLDENIVQSSRFGRKALGKAGGWRLVEAVIPLMAIIESEYAKTGKINRAALRSLKELEASSIEVLPRLEALYDQVKKDGNSSFREIESIEFALQVISQEGEISKKRRERGSGKYVEQKDEDVGLIPDNNFRRNSIYVLVIVLLVGGFFFFIRKNN